MKINISVLFIFILISCSQNQKLVHQESKIDIKSIDYAYITKGINEAESIRLTQMQINEIVEEWNNAEIKGLYKMIPEFWLTIKLKNGKQRRFKANNGLMKENSDWAYSISNTTLFDSFWEPEHVYIPTLK